MDNFPIFSRIGNINLWYLPITWVNLYLAYLIVILMVCVKVFSTVLSGNLSHPLMLYIILCMVFHLDSGCFWLLLTGFLSRGWIIALIGCEIQSSPFWSTLSSEKSWCLLISFESRKKSFSCALLYFYSVTCHSFNSKWPKLSWWYLKQRTGLTT